MSRPDSSAYDLTDTEKRDLTELIEPGKPLAEKYRFLIFAGPAGRDEVELVWTAFGGEPESRWDSYRATSSPGR